MLYYQSINRPRTCATARSIYQELFTKIMEILANFTFNFNFFQPDCSVSSPYWYTWLGLPDCRKVAETGLGVGRSEIVRACPRFTVAPYFMMAPITFSYIVVRWMSFRESRGDPQYRAAWLALLCRCNTECRFMFPSRTALAGRNTQEVQSWLLLNAWGRAMLTILLLFIQMHMTKLSSPFQCNTLKDGSAVMVDSTDIYCNSGCPPGLDARTEKTHLWTYIYYN